MALPREGGEPELSGENRFFLSGFRWEGKSLEENKKKQSKAEEMESAHPTLIESISDGFS
jgi:hypothetical protein